MRHARMRMPHGAGGAQTLPKRLHIVDVPLLCGTVPALDADRPRQHLVLTVPRPEVDVLRPGTVAAQTQGAALEDQHVTAGEPDVLDLGGLHPLVHEGLTDQDVGDEAGVVDDVDRHRSGGRLEHTTRPPDDGRLAHLDRGRAPTGDNQQGKKRENRKALAHGSLSRCCGLGSLQGPGLFVLYHTRACEVKRESFSYF